MHASSFHLNPFTAKAFMGLATPLALAQSVNTTTCGFNQVPGIQEGGFYHNASANASFPVHGEGDWRLTLTLTEQREDEYGIDSWGPSNIPILNYMLSVPETFLNKSGAGETTTSVCIYPMVGQHYSSYGGESPLNNIGFSSHGCNGVLSEACLLALRAMNPPNAGTRRCPDYSNEAREACDLWGSVRPTAASNFSDSAKCESAQIPGVDFPNGTRLYDLWTFYYDPSRTLRQSNMHRDQAYDLYVRQSWPVMLTLNTWARGGGVERLDRVVTCLSPGDNIVQGSRVPQGGRFPALNESEDDEGNGDDGGGGQDSNDEEDDSGANGRHLPAWALLLIVLALVNL